MQWLDITGLKKSSYALLFKKNYQQKGKQKGYKFNAIINLI